MKKKVKTKVLKVLNLYAGIGGNRKLWKNVDVTAVELNPDIAQIYKDFYLNDTVIVGDAHEYLLNNFQDFDFIWSSPPCPSHGQYRHNVGVKAKGFKAVYPDLKLYEEILLLKHHCTVPWVVENTIAYYTPLVTPKRLGRHYVWSNFYIPDEDYEKSDIRNKSKLTDFDIDLSQYKLANKRQVLRNCVDSTFGSNVLKAARRPTAFSTLLLGG